MEDLCDKHLFFKKKDSIIGQGAEGYVHEACSKKQIESSSKRCGFVVKEKPLHTETDIDEMAGKTGIGPQVFVEVCPRAKTTYLIQERLNGTLKDYIAKHGLSTKTRKKLSDLIFRSIDIMKIFHNDLHSENIMYKIMPNRDIRFYLVDFSSAKKINDIGSIAFDKSLESHTYIENEGEDVQILSPSMVQHLSALYRPSVDQSEKEIKKRKQLQQIKNKARKEMQQRLKSFKLPSKKVQQKKSPKKKTEDFPNCIALTDLDNFVRYIKLQHDEKKCENIEKLGLPSCL